MTALERALAELVGFLEGQGIPYMLIGGMANAVWGEPRATLDIDVTVWVPEGERDQRVAALAARFAPLVGDPRTFVEGTRVLPLQTHEGVRLDVIFGMLPFEEEAIRRARPMPLAGVPVRVCTVEDLILLKIVSERDRDLQDVEGLVRHRLGDLDLDYLEPRIRELADLLSRPEIALRWSAWKATHSGRG